MIVLLEAAASLAQCAQSEREIAEPKYFPSPPIY